MGKKYHDLTVIKFDENSYKKNCAYWICKCDCGKIVSVRSLSLRKGHTKSCSKSCLHNLIGQKIDKVTVLSRDEYIYYKNKKHKDLVYNCVCECGNKIKLRRGQLKDKRYICQCENCHCPDLSGQKINKLSIIGKSKIKKNGRTYWICKCDCGNVKDIEGSALRRGTIISCGCHRKFIKSGKNSNFYTNGNWATGKWTRLAKIRRSTEYGKWRRAVLKKYKYTCQCCDYVSKDKRGIAAHHILSFVDNEDQRLNVNNGIVLCLDCHNKFHKIYGSGKNTLLQLQEFFIKEKARL